MEAKGAKVLKKKEKSSNFASLKKQKIDLFHR